MKQLVECVPNFSEGRDKNKVEAIVAAARAVPGVTILDVETDPDHNRCVLSFVAPPQAAVEACFRVAQKSRDLIDLNKHKGEHPRMGAVDVIPFIPVSGIEIRECCRLAEKLGERIGRDLEIPVYLYDHAARRPERKDLATVRKGQFEGLRDLIGKDPARRPDFGPNKIHPTAGATAVGARRQIINFNLNLDTHDMAVGKDIAKRVRASGGGLQAVRAKEIDLAARQQAQISTVLTDYKATSMKKVITETARLAAEHGVKIKTTEIVGLLPREVLVDFAVETLQLENFNPQVQILENRLKAVEALGGEDRGGWQQAGELVADSLSNTDATPGGGSAAGISGAMGCGLGLMAIGISLKSKKLDPANRPILEQAQAELRAFKSDFHKLTGEDAAAFDRFMEAAALRKDDSSRPGKMQAALTHAAEVPLKTAAAAAAAYQAVNHALPAGGTAVVSDMQCALHLLKCAGLCAAENVRINLGGLKDADKARDLEAGLSACLKVF
ncbi:MAG: glutamate formimidoyltransferase [Elusimicrobia bacterium RIFCSPHIGHO2_02_FULL_57_9]|nr:MAG: glutamate formimidoyltransferase [Elusimicrobia bacterium RIFCSPHIGHO2_02_FULL_57_9]